MASKKSYVCPYCGKRFVRDDMVKHISKNHIESLPEGFTPLRMTFHIVNKKPIDYAAPCRICKKPTSWDEKKGRYNFLCDNPECKKKWIQNMKDTMGDKYGKFRPTATPEGLEKMLAARKISGKYKYSDGVIFTYTGSYELECLKFMDKVLELKSEDLQMPGPVMKYVMDNTVHYYIPDIYYRPYNLIIEVKDGGSNPNKNEKYEGTRKRQMAKEEYVIKHTNYNYLRLTDKDFSQLLAVFADLKMSSMEPEPRRVVQVNESVSGFNRLYHGSHNGNIHKLIPKNLSYNNGEYVFATPDYKFALCYAGNSWHDGILNQSYYNNKLCLTELRENVFKEVFDTDGYVYTIKSDIELFKPLDHSKIEYISEIEVNVDERKYIKNVWKELQKQDIELYHYPDKPRWWKKEYELNIEASIESVIEKDHKQKGKKELSEFKKVPIDENFLKRFTNKTKLLKDSDKSEFGFGWLDSDNKLVGYVMCNDWGWITAIEISDQYKQYGLGKQLLKYAIDHMGGNRLGVHENNEIAKRLYRSMGFREVSAKSINGSGEKGMIFMTNDNSIKETMSNFKDNLNINEASIKSSNSENLYRYTYDGVGIYEALKQNINQEEWKKFLSSKYTNWLPKPPKYLTGYSSYFTELGKKAFDKVTLPMMLKFLDKNKVKIEKTSLSDKPVYSDKYQVVLKEDSISEVADFKPDLTKKDVSDISTVYFTSKLSPESVITLYETLIEESNRILEPKVGVKLHTGEAGNKNFIGPDFWGPMIHHINGTIVECNTAYPGMRNTTENHKKVIHDHGWDNFEVDIMDEDGDLEIPVNSGEYLKTNIVGSHLPDYKSLLVLTHFKGHAMGGFGGALKNISIGLASSHGKKKIHRIQPDEIVSTDNNIDQNEFIDCMAEAAGSILEYIGRNNMIFINALKNISVDCDCDSEAEPPVMEDIGLLISTDPVAIDQACYDIINISNDPGKDKILERIHSRNGTRILETAERLGVGNRKYNIINLDDYDSKYKESLKESDIEFNQALEEISNMTVKENMFSTIQGFIPPVSTFDDNDIVVVNYLKHNTFSDENDYAVALSPKLDKIFYRDKGLLKYSESVIDLGNYTPYRVININKSKLLEEFKSNLNKEVDHYYIYESVFGHTVYTEDQIMFEENAIELEDYYATNKAIYENMVNYLSESYNKKNEDPNITKRYGIISDDGVYNACCMVSGYDKPMRERASLLVFKDDTLFGRIKPDEVTMPGGGLNKGESSEEAAIRETKEEARMLVKNVLPAGILIEYHETVKDWVKEHVAEKDWWYGYHTAIYIGEYAGEYKGKIDKEDIDEMYEKGKFYPINKIYPKLCKEYKQAVDMYYENKMAQIKQDLQED